MADEWDEAAAAVAKSIEGRSYDFERDEYDNDDEPCGISVDWHSVADAITKAVAAALRTADANAYVRGKRDGMEQAAATAEAWARPQQIRMHAGEMTAQEARTGKALLNGVAASIRRSAEDA